MHCRIAVAVLLLAGCTGAPPVSDTPIVVTSVLPQAWLVRELAGDLVRVEVLIPPGASPATFEPTASQMRTMASAALFYRVGHPDFPFEKAWLEPMLDDLPDLRIVSDADGAALLHDDPHLWVSPRTARSSAVRLAAELQTLLPEHRDLVSERLRALTGRLETLDREIAELLAPHAGRRFLVFHPAWGYFAVAYGLEQVAVEHEGKEPAPAELIELARRMRSEGIEVLFVQPQISPRSAEAVARELGMRVVVADPLAAEWDENLRRVAKALDEAFRSGEVSTGSRGPAGGAQKVRGIIVSTHTDGHEWGLEVMATTLDDIRDLGAGWIATHPYAAVRADGTVRFPPVDRDSPPDYLVRPIREAHARGLRIVIKPHLAYWGSPFAWRGAIRFESEEAWSTFFRDYTEWIVAVAAACAEADGFVIGTELDGTVHREQEWRALIDRVREVTGAPLTYAANWTDYRRVPFWDAVDVIGVQAYFPVADRPGADEAVVASGWRRRMAELRAFAGPLDRPVVFTELGYNRSLHAAVRPWDPATDGPEAEPFQEACLRIALEAVEREPVVVGAFLWKWFPNPRPVGRNFQLATPRLRRAIADVWR